jgi:hypothetical protein
MGKKILLVAGLLIIIGGSAYLLFRKKEDEGAETGAEAESGSGSSNQGGGGGSGSKPSSGRTPASVQKNVGTGGYVKMLKDGTLEVRFNSGKNRAMFYSNGRFAIYPQRSSNFIAKGSYDNGGKKLVVDGGKTIESGSVWNNLKSTLPIK